MAAILSRPPCVISCNVSFQNQGPRYNNLTIFMGIPILQIRRHPDRLILAMGILVLDIILISRLLYLNTDDFNFGHFYVSWWFCTGEFNPNPGLLHWYWVTHPTAPAPVHQTPSVYHCLQNHIGYDSDKFIRQSKICMTQSKLMLLSSDYVTQSGLSKSKHQISFVEVLIVKNCQC